MPAGLQRGNPQPALCHNVHMDRGSAFGGRPDIPPRVPDPDWRVRFGHGQRHLQGTGLAAADVHATITEHIVHGMGRASHVGESFFGRVIVQGQIIEYRARHLGGGDINVGTYYPIP